MKLIKIGRSSTCDIVLPSENVSSLHAELLIMDNGEIFIEDKNSTNGTLVGNKKIVPNSEVPVRRGDYIVLADMELPWSRVPQPENVSGFKQVVNIGTNFRNDIVLDGVYGSRFHANLKISKNGKKAFIKDLHSKNGVKVNGVKIQAGKDYEIKRNDVILCGDADISEQILPYLPKPFPLGKVAATLVGIAALIVSLFYIIPGIWGPDVPKDLRPATVYVYTKYYYTVKLEDNPLSEIWDGLIRLESSPFGASGTAFFIDKNGHMGTNRHVALPWEYRDEKTNNEIRNMVEEWLNNSVANMKEVHTPDEYKAFQSSYLGNMIDKRTKTLKEMNAALSRLLKSPIEISGEVVSRYIGYPGRNYNNPEVEMQRCDLIAESGTPEQDIAILQLNTKKTPQEDIEYIFDIKEFRMDKLEPMEEQLYTIGYPHGLNWGLSKEAKSLEPGIRSVQCSKVPERYNFEFQGESVGGASGSPIFDKKGHLVGVLWGGWKDGTTYGLACQAKWLKELYEKEVGIE